MGTARSILKGIVDPMSGYSILDVGIVEKVFVKGKDITVRVNLPKYCSTVKTYIISEIKSKLITLPKVEKVVVQISKCTLKYPLV